MAIDSTAKGAASSVVRASTGGGVPTNADSQGDSGQTGPPVDSVVGTASDGIVRELRHDDFGPVGTLVLVLVYMAVLVGMWVFVHFVEFLGWGLTVVRQMETHTYEKLWLALALALIVGFIRTITYGAAGAGIEMIDDEGDTVDPATLDQHPKFGDPGIERVGENSYDVYVVARQFVLEPGTTEPLRVLAGSTVAFHVTAADIIHGFGVVDTNANTTAISGQVSEFTAQFEEAGEHGILCNEYCGSGRHMMEGEIVVMERGEFDSWYEQRQAQGEVES